MRDGWRNHRGNRMDDVILARQLRLSVITNVWRQGLLNEEAARRLLAMPLSPGDDSTIYDDSALLGDCDGLEKIANSAPEPVADARRLPRVLAVD